MVSDDVPDQLRAGVSAGAFQPGGVVSPKSGAGSVRAPAADPGGGARTGPVRLPPDLGPTPPRGLADQPQAGASALSAGRPTGADAWPPAQSYGRAPLPYPRC